MKFYLKFKYFYSRKCVWTCRLRNGGHFVPGEISYFPKFNWANVEVWEWIRKFIPHLKRCDYESILRFQLIYVSKGTTGAPARILATGREIPNQYGKDVWYKTKTKITPLPWVISFHLEKLLGHYFAMRHVRFPAWNFRFCGRRWRCGRNNKNIKKVNLWPKNICLCIKIKCAYWYSSLIKSMPIT